MRRRIVAEAGTSKSQSAVLRDSRVRPRAGSPSRRAAPSRIRCDLVSKAKSRGSANPPELAMVLSGRFYYVLASSRR